MDGTFPSRITSRKPLIAPDDIKEIRSGRICKIAARILEKDGVSKILRIWLEYQGNFDQSLQGTPLHEFCIVTFPYSASMDKPNTLIDDLVKYNEKNEGDSGEEIEGDSVEEFDECLKEVMNSALTNYCGLCRDKMIPDTDAAALLKTDTGRLVCTERNSTGAYHVYHLTCLVRWILICEAKKIEEGQNFSVYCPECEGIGVIIDENGMKQFAPKRLEREGLVLKMRAGAIEWQEFPEALENISFGLGFPREENFLQELLSTLYVMRISKWVKP